MLELDFSNILYSFNQLMESGFYISLFILVFILISFQILWLIGIKIKSEKLIKLGVRISFTTLFLILFLILTIIVVAKIK